MPYSPQSHFLGDSNFPLSAREFYKDERIRLLQHFYTTYSGLALTKLSDRPRAIAGLQKRIARVLKSSVDHGVLWRWPGRMLLWCAAQPGSLTRISYDDADFKPPSWSWMGYGGRIAFLDIDFGGVVWTDHVRGPPDAPDWALKVEARGLQVDVSVLEERAHLDTESSNALEDSWRCVLLGKEMMGKYGNEAAHYVLLVRPVTQSSLSLHSDQPQAFYERVGVASLLASHFSSDEVSARLI